MTIEKNKCASMVWSLHGLDIIKCDLPKGHNGLHKSIGIFSNSWTNEQALTTAEKQFLKREKP